MQEHNYDCAYCGEPCKITGHDPCAKAPLGFCTRTVRCWNHNLKTWRESKVSIDRKPERRDWRPDGRSETHEPVRDWRPRWPRYKQVERAQRREPVAPIDSDLRDLIEGKQKASDESIRERIEKGEM